MAVGTLSCARCRGHTWARGQRCHLAALVLLQGGKGERGLPGSYGSKGEKGDRVSVPSRAPPCPGVLWAMGTPLLLSHVPPRAISFPPAGC